MSFLGTVLVMAGGRGTRFWPLSTKKHPKQYLPLAPSGLSLLEDTISRFTHSVESQDQFILTTKEQINLAEKYSLSLPKENILIEPDMRNTAPALLLAALYLRDRGQNLDNPLTILPADHVILNKKAFIKDIERACSHISAEGGVVTLGIKPHFPHTGFGYINVSKKLGPNFYVLNKFVEKPDLETAKNFLSQGSYYWNAGIFILKLSDLLNYFEELCPQFHDFMKIKEHNERLKNYHLLENISFDYAVMEKIEQAYCLEASFDWNDCGSWDAMEQILDLGENTLIQNNPHYIKNSKGNIVYTDKNKFVSLVDVQDLIVVSNEKALFVIPKKMSQKVKEVVSYLEKNGQSDLT